MRILEIIRPVSKATDVFGKADARPELLVEDVALVHEQDELDLGHLPGSVQWESSPAQGR